MQTNEYPRLLFVCAEFIRSPRPVGWPTYVQRCLGRWRGKAPTQGLCCPRIRPCSTVSRTRERSCGCAMAGGSYWLGRRTICCRFICSISLICFAGRAALIRIPSGAIGRIIIGVMRLSAAPRSPWRCVAMLRDGRRIWCMRTIGTLLWFRPCWRCTTAAAPGRADHP